MAINPSTNSVIGDRINAPDAAYPQGSSKDETVAGQRDGTPQFSGRSNDIFGLQQALLKSSNSVPTGNPDTALESQYMQAIIELASGRAVTYDDVGVADAYVLNLRTNQQAPASLFDGLIAVFTPLNTNTGASTVNVTGFGVKNIVDISGNPPSAGVLVAGQRAELVYELGADRFVHLNPEASALHPSLFQAGATGIINAQNDLIPSINGGDPALFDISAGQYVIADSYTDPFNPTETVITFPGVVAQTVNNLATASATFLYLDNVGSVVQESTLQEGAYLRDHVFVGFLGHNPSVIIQATSLTQTTLNNTLMSFADLRFCMGALNCVTGGQNRITGNAGTLGLDKAAGEWYSHGINVRNDMKNPDLKISAALVKPFMGIGWRVTDNPNGKLILQDTIPAGVYDDGTAVFADALPLGTVTVNVWLNNRIFMTVSSNQLAVQIGQETYNSEAAAAAGVTKEDFEIIPVLSRTTPLATVTMRGGSLDLTLIADASIRQAIPPRATFQ